MKSAHAQFAICLDNESFPASLEIGKLYQVIPDEQAVSNGLIRIIDESGKDYAFSGAFMRSTFRDTLKPYC